MNWQGLLNRHIVRAPVFSFRSTRLLPTRGLLARNGFRVAGYSSPAHKIGREQVTLHVAGCTLILASSPKNALGPFSGLEFQLV